jgi:hypothetical protein
MDREEVYRELKGRVTNVRFEELCQVAESFGFKFKGGKGSHRIFVREGVKELLNFQDVGGKAKPYKVRQFIKLIEKYNLVEG